MQLEVGKYYRTRDGRKAGPLEKYSDRWPFVGPIGGDEPGFLWEADGTNYDGTDSPHTLVGEWVEDATAIVAVIRNGRPAPNPNPYLHANRDAALTEAKRLAAANPGQEFAVYQRVGGAVADVSVREVA